REHRRRLGLACGPCAVVRIPPTIPSLRGPRTPFFDRYIRIDYSEARTPTSSLKGLRIYIADQTVPPHERVPPRSPRRYWARRGIAEWLGTQVSGEKPLLVGIDHGFSFPLRYFERHRLQHDWPLFLEDFQHRWPTDETNTY